MLHGQEDLVSVDIKGILQTLGQIDGHLLVLNEQDQPPKWARAAALEDRLDALEMESGFTKVLPDICGGPEDLVMIKAMEDLVDQGAALRVGSESDINLLYSNLSRIKKAFRSKPNQSEVTAVVDEMVEFRKHFSQQLSEVEHNIRMEAEQSFWVSPNPNTNPKPILTLNSNLNRNPPTVHQ